MYPYFPVQYTYGFPLPVFTKCIRYCVCIKTILLTAMKHNKFQTIKCELIQ